MPTFAALTMSRTIPSWPAWQPYVMFNKQGGPQIEEPVSAMGCVNGGWGGTDHGHYAVGS